MQRIGRHLILELWGCDSDSINSIETIERAITETIEACGATLLDLRVYPFTPQGVTGVAILSESHFMIHTWPEHGYAAVDVFTCGTTVDPWKATLYLENELEAKKVEINSLLRGKIHS